MAEMIPDTLPASSTAGERRVFATLGRLPDDCLIYYESVVRRRYPDLIAILPEVGVLAIEVKDWRLAELGSVNADTVTITRRGTATVVPHPRRQAREYMLRLMDECRRHPQAGMLMQKEGRHAGGRTAEGTRAAVALAPVDAGDRSDQPIARAEALALPPRSGHVGSSQSCPATCRNPVPLQGLARRTRARGTHRRVHCPVFFFEKSPSRRQSPVPRVYVNARCDTGFHQNVGFPTTFALKGICDVPFSHPATDRARHASNLFADAPRPAAMMRILIE